MLNHHYYYTRKPDLRDTVRQAFQKMKHPHNPTRKNLGGYHMFHSAEIQQNRRTAKNRTLHYFNPKRFAGALHTYKIKEKKV